MDLVQSNMIYVQTFELVYSVQFLEAETFEIAFNMQSLLFNEDFRPSFAFDTAVSQSSSQRMRSSFHFPKRSSEVV